MDLDLEDNKRLGMNFTLRNVTTDNGVKMLTNGDIITSDEAISSRNAEIYA